MASMAESHHLDESLWERLACDELDAEQRRTAMEHVSTCDECARVYRALIALRDEAAGFDPGVPVAPRAPRPVGVPRWAYPLGAAAAVALVFVLQREAVRAPGPAPRTSSVRTIGLAPLTVAPRGTLAEVPRVFRWRADPSADSYRVRLLSPDGAIIWQSGPVAGGEVEIPARLRIGAGTYFWDVAAYRAGERIGESELTRFEVPR